ncbi:glycosyltransferase family 4 protein [Novosphingobium profundi]|uniref:glycosyltransferase family 4 protein n=1 Tax=Novosphingobium profundi TaxID=1774954 RepID=UPI001BD94033|nr:glycosyltransferase family 4 protein [Novosphingobium profundi]MBT0668354.1 glycosyltransferase family 4 protein [Novosphingobium profundi]
MSKDTKFVFVANRNRDGYNVPRALEEGGLLDAMVTDFYAPARGGSWLPAILRARSCEGLPSAKASSTWGSFVLQAFGERFKRYRRTMIKRSDRLLARKAMKRAAAHKANLYCYSSYMPRPGEKPEGIKVIDFEFHPHPQLTWQLLSDDAKRYPEVAWSMLHEEEILNRVQVTQVWREADAVVCASSMTQRSLEHVGCPPERITVIPYGFAAPASVPEARPQGTCEFLFVGQGVSRKGLHHLIRAWQASPPPNARLTLVCYRIDPGIKAMIDCPSIVLLGRQERAALDALFAKADIFVLPSLVEGFGLVYLEALAAGCHVIGTVNTGLPDLPLSEKAATIVEVGNLAALGEALHGTAQRKADGELHAPSIAAEAGNWRWSQFRDGIVRHARDVVGA